MMVVFFIGAGASSLLASTATTPLQVGVFLTLIGMFAAIYHPVGLAMVVQGRKKTGVPLAINGNDAMNLIDLKDLANPNTTGWKTCAVKVSKA